MALVRQASHLAHSIAFNLPIRPFSSSRALLQQVAKINDAKNAPAVLDTRVEVFVDDKRGKVVIESEVCWCVYPNQSINQQVDRTIESANQSINQLIDCMTH